MSRKSDITLPGYFQLIEFVKEVAGDKYTHLLLSSAAAFVYRRGAEKIFRHRRWVKENFRTTLLEYIKTKIGQETDFKAAADRGSKDEIIPLVAFIKRELISKNCIPGQVLVNRLAVYFRIKGFSVPIDDICYMDPAMADEANLVIKKHIDTQNGNSLFISPTPKKKTNSRSNKPLLVQKVQPSSVKPVGHVPSQMELITVKAAAAILSIKPQTLYLMLKKPGCDIPAIHISNKIIRIERNAFMEWINRHRAII